MVEQDTLLFGFWTGIMAGFTFLWATMLATWFLRRDSRALVYVILLVNLSLISGINAVIRGLVWPIDPLTLVAIQRGLWVAVLITGFAIVDIYHASHANCPPYVVRLWWRLRFRRTGGHHQAQIHEGMGG